MTLAHLKRFEFLGLALAVVLGAVLYFVYSARRHEVLTRTLLDAMDRNDFRAAKALIAKGADVNVRDGQGRMPLIFMVEHGQIFATKSLLERGVDVNAKDNDGETALMKVPSNETVAQALLAKGADVNAQNNNGETALMFAADRGYVSVARTLLAKGADVNVKNRWGETALTWAAGGRSHQQESNNPPLDTSRWEAAPLANMGVRRRPDRGNPAIVQALLDKGADVNVRDESGNTPLKWAEMRGRTDIVELLKTAGAKE